VFKSDINLSIIALLAVAQFFAALFCLLRLNSSGDSHELASAFFALIIFALVSSSVTAVVVIKRLRNQRDSSSLLQSKSTSTEDNTDVHLLSINRALSRGSTQAKAYIDNMPVGLLTLDHAGVIQVANLRALQILHLSVNKVVGRSVTDFIRIDDQTDQSYSFETLCQKLLGTLSEAKALAGNSFSTPIDAALADYQGFGGQGYILNFSDLTQRYQVERLKEEFLSMVSHDLRSPLSSIKLFCSGLLAKETKEFTAYDKQAVEVAHNEVNRLIRLVNSLLDLSMIRSGKLELNREEIDLADLLDKVRSGAAYAARFRNVSVVIEAAGTIVVADYDRIYQVVENLLGNALKYTRKNSTVCLKVTQQKDYVRVSVKDEGEGIAEDFREKIFDRFQQIDDVDSTVHGGKGLGLAICKFIIVQHGGEVGVSSEPGSGSDFWFTLPA
jgi:signal transduction histidine kinase